LSSCQSISIRVFLHTSNKRAETTALLDSGATENFINKRYARWLRLPFKRLAKPRAVYNVDGSKNSQGDIKFYTDLEVQTSDGQAGPESPSPAKPCPKKPRPSRAQALFRPLSWAGLEMLKAQAKPSSPGLGILFFCFIFCPYRIHFC